MQRQVTARSVGKKAGKDAVFIFQNLLSIVKIEFPTDKLNSANERDINKIEFTAKEDVTALANEVSLQRLLTPWVAFSGGEGTEEAPFTGTYDADGHSLRGADYLTDQSGQPFARQPQFCSYRKRHRHRNRI